MEMICGRMGRRKQGTHARTLNGIEGKAGTGRSMFDGSMSRVCEE